MRRAWAFGRAASAGLARAKICEVRTVRGDLRPPPGFSPRLSIVVLLTPESHARQQHRLAGPNRAQARPSASSRGADEGLSRRVGKRLGRVPFTASTRFRLIRRTAASSDEPGAALAKFTGRARRVDSARDGVYVRPGGASRAPLACTVCSCFACRRALGANSAAARAVRQEQSRAGRLAARGFQAEPRTVALTDGKLAHQEDVENGCNCSEMIGGGAAQTAARETALSLDISPSAALRRAP